MANRALSKTNRALNPTKQNNMASMASHSAQEAQVTSTQPRLHGACILPGHILVNERFHGSEIVKALQGLSLVVSLFCLTGMVRAYFAPKFKFENNTTENHLLRMVHSAIYVSLFILTKVLKLKLPFFLVYHSL